MYVTLEGRIVDSDHESGDVPSATADENNGLKLLVNEKLMK
jgi:hypothetical protein